MKLTPLKAIKKYCIGCSGFEKKQVRECVIKDCPLYPYRQGKNPNRKGSTLSKNSASAKGFETAGNYVSDDGVCPESEC